MRSQTEIDLVLRDVQNILDAKRKSGAMAYHVPTGGYSQIDDWLSVIVEPDVEGMHAYQYVEALGEFDDELRKRGIEKVVLVPAIA